MNEIIMTQLSPKTLEQMVEKSLIKILKPFIEKLLKGNDKKKEDELLTPKQVADILKCTKPTLWNWEQKDILKPLRFGGLVRYSKSQIDEFIISREHNIIELNKKI